MHVFWFFSLVIIQLTLLDHQHCISAHNAVVHPPEASEYNGTLYAACKIKPNQPTSAGPKVYGTVLFKQDSPQGKLSVSIQLHGFDRDSAEAKAVHIHQFGDLSSSCASTRGHYNPNNVNHPQHPGDFGNFMTQDGRINAMLESEATLFGGHSVIGRAVVVHQQQDDLGQGGDASSLQNGNAGPRIGCCVIGITSAELWTKHTNKPKTIKRSRVN
ncbi:extracellular superoxide dismutase [Cu-Zn]-like [Eucyclogobius newberryi]|uniref:extracellular superoxide dismutase [Cu-Zn]-like n=1 Tax=Eucyclogobius newberryi TaxID=166745 RepID=UPI003B5CF0EE